MILTSVFLLAFVDIFAECSISSVARIAKAVDRADRVIARSIRIAEIKCAFVDVSAFCFSVAFVARVAWAVESSRKVDTRSESHARIICTFIDVRKGLQIIVKMVLKTQKKGPINYTKIR